MMTTEPAWLTAARAKLGTREAAGPADNPTIIGWAKRLGIGVLGIAYNADSVPWCGLFVATCLREVMPDEPLPRIAVRASAWDAFGVATMPCLGAVLRFSRAGGGHVGFAVGQDATHYHVLGGNQGDRVSIMRIDKARLVTARWPASQATRIRAPLPRLGAAGVAASRNEA